MKVSAPKCMSSDFPKLANELNINIIFFQTNHEGEMVERIHKAITENISGVLINAGAWTHYSYAISDALAMIHVPIIEIHLSNIHNREDFRHKSVFSSIVKGQICGLGMDSYLLGLRGLSSFL